jgi:uncharacterized protein YndB with AHSA1/START domain
MSDRFITHATFTLERTYPVSPEAVFAAWADPAAKVQWFAGPGAGHQLDFRVDGRESCHGRAPTGEALTFESVYRDILAGERIVYSSTLRAGNRLSTISITTVEFAPAHDGTRLLLTEQGTFLDGLEQPEWRERGTAGQLTALAAILGKETA